MAIHNVMSIVDSAINKQLSPYFSEYALFSSRIFVEAKYLLALSQLKICRQFDDNEKQFLSKMHNISLEDFEIIKAIEQKGYLFSHNSEQIIFEKTNHDVKAMEYFMRMKFMSTSLNNCKNWIHFGLTSEDVNNLANTRNMQLFLKDVYMQAMLQVNEKLKLILTQDELASLLQITDELNNFSFSAKLMSATGNLAAHQFAFPNVNWLEFSRDFVQSLGFTPNMYVTQVEPKDNYVELFQLIENYNKIIMKGENDETVEYFSISNAFISAFKQKFQKSRLQRDLSDSTMQRNIGVAFGYSLLGLNKTLNGLQQSCEVLNPFFLNQAVAVSPLNGRYFLRINELLKFNNFAQAANKLYLPQLQYVISHLEKNADENAFCPMLSLTHGQPATPTTLGKEYKIYAERLKKQQSKLNAHLIKLNEIGLSQTIYRINNIVADLAVNFWLYIMQEIFVQQKTGAGSSIMPHKINPINFENAEGNTYIANALLDLSASNWKESLGYSLIALSSLEKALEKITPNNQKIMQQLQLHPEVLSEAYQTELRKPEYNLPDPYKLFKDFTQGRRITLDLLHNFIDSLKIPNEAKHKLINLNVDEYTGYAVELAKGKYKF